GVMCCDNGFYSPLRVIGQLRKGQELVVRLYEDNENAGDIVPVDGPIDIVYEDEDFIVLNKPGDMVIHPSYAHYMDSLSNYLAGYYKRTLQEHVVRTVGRLDRETSGLVIFAKNRHSAALLGNQKENMSRRKEYLAICEGFFDKKDGTVDAPIRQKPDERMIREVHPLGKEAITHFHVEKQYDDYALVRLVLDTGRTHQIRVHMAYIGHPLVGDNFYGNKEKTYGLNRAALHAERISFIHPINIEEISLSADIPEDMKKLL
ncbi:MAG: RluA family pseudouridine synthase, partial [Butyrivibrio sp.]|nr:RluA family pseudouridine synthase [Butyrivibrio sp.]